MKNNITKDIEYMKYVLGYKRGVVISEQQSTEVCIKGNCVNGKGTYKYENGDEYTGQWIDGNWEDGEGTYKYASGAAYTGKWKDGEKNGKGTYTNINGVNFLGNWVNDKLEGKGPYDLDKIKPTKKPSNNATEPNNAQSNLNCVKPTEPTHRYKNDRNYQYAKSDECWWAKNINNKKWINLTKLVKTKPNIQISIDKLDKGLENGTDLIKL